MKSAGSVCLPVHTFTARPDGSNNKFLWKRVTCWTFCCPDVADTAVIDFDDIILKLPQSDVSGISRRIVTLIFGLAGYTLN